MASLEHRVADPERAGRALGIAEHQDLAGLELAAGGGRRYGGEEVHGGGDGPLRHGRGRNLAERQRHAERGRAPGVGLGAVRVARHERGAAPVGVGHAGGGQQRPLHLDVVDVGGVGDAGLRPGLAHGLGDGLHHRHRADLLRREVPRAGDAEGEALAAAGAGLAGHAGEQRRVGREHPLAAARPDEGDPAPDLLRRAAEVPRQYQLVRQGRVAAGEVVGAAVALGLADQRHDRGGIDRAGGDQPIELGNVVRRRHGDLVDTDLHGFTPHRRRRRARRRPR